MILLNAEPEPLEIDLKRMAIIVVDMQNAFLSPGGLFDLAGQDISMKARTVEPIREIIGAARANNIKVIYIAHTLSPDLREIAPSSPFWYKRVARYYRERPEMKDKYLTRGTWGAEIIEELKPRKEDILVEKMRFSAFFGTTLDSILRTYDFKYLAFTGVATNVCVELTLRDAFHLEYFSILVSDATATSSPSAYNEAIQNVKTCFGWVTTAKELVKAIR